MATLAFSLAGQFAGELIGGPLGATFGRAAGALVGNAIDQQLFGGSQIVGTRKDDLRVLDSTNGTPMPKVYGWARLSGKLIWATNLEERLEDVDEGTKGTSSQKNYRYYANIAVAVCEGEISKFGRIWADGNLLDTQNLTLRTYRGTQNQLPDSLIEAKMGAGQTPAYRGTAYIVFERMPLEKFGNRIPQLSFEVNRAIDVVEQKLSAVTIIPGATEFGYDLEKRVRVLAPGISVAENVHQEPGRTDWQLSIDELMALFPNLKKVALVVSWFGTDLRCGQCDIKPGVDSDDKNIKNIEWSVAGQTRQTAHLISKSGSGAAFGGTPNDASVVAAIKDLKARGLQVYLYPFIMMDVPKSNSLIDPYTGHMGQPVYPWRGRITCDPAPLQSNSPDKSAQVQAQIDAFVGQASALDFSSANNVVHYTGATEWSFRRFVLHHAFLGQAAGGIDGFLIGSEMRGMSQLRSGDTDFPFVDALKNLARDVRGVVGANTKITYAADWSEYAGYHPNDGSDDHLFHLDALWAHPDIDAVGIDNYMPLSDWRDGHDHLDAQINNKIYDLDYLKSQIAHGELYDWYYRDENARNIQARSAITDDAYAEPFIFRQKDLVGWWQNSHTHRVAGVKHAHATDWVPQSKPIWFTEFGCPAIDKGTNQPNVFFDPKSSESYTPYFSTGNADHLIQRQYLRAHLTYWDPADPDFKASFNPISNSYGGTMVDIEHMFAWAWDARPYPAFPSLKHVWSDGGNWATGHWLNGRMGGVSAGAVLQAMAHDFGLENFNAQVPGLPIDGYVVDEIISFRRAAEPIIEAAQLIMHGREDAIVVRELAVSPIKHLDDSSLIEPDSGSSLDSSLVLKRDEAQDSPARFIFGYQDRAKDYQAHVATSMHEAARSNSSKSLNTAIVTGLSTAFGIAHELLSKAQASMNSAQLSLGIKDIALEPGDIISFHQGYAAMYAIQKLEQSNNVIDVEALGHQIQMHFVPKTEDLNLFSQVFEPGDIVGAGCVLPLGETNQKRAKLYLGAFTSPWPGRLLVYAQKGAAFEQIGMLSNPAQMGQLVQPLQPLQHQYFDDVSVLDVAMFHGHLSSVSDLDILNGANRAAVYTSAGAYEIIQFGKAELIDTNTYRLTHLLRGVDGTLAAQGDGAHIGADFVILNDALFEIALDVDLTGIELNFVLAQENDLPTSEFAQKVQVKAITEQLSSLPPTHLMAVRYRLENDVQISWVRQSREGGQSWVPVNIPLDDTQMRFRLTISLNDIVKREIELGDTQFTYTEAMQIDDFGRVATTFDFKVLQLNTLYGAGKSAQGRFDG